ncbi:16S rRNA (guanine(527)-N(7))-methyltransferase RsmG [Petrachloros mirabilis]
MEHEESLREFLIRSAAELGLSLFEKQTEQFMLYLDTLLQWNKVTNLTSVTDPQEVIIKHFVDSLALLAMFDIPRNAFLIDIGSGAGFPGIPIKIFRSDIRIILVEPIKKKCSFLHSIIGLLKLDDISVFAGTLQLYSGRPVIDRADIMTARAIRFEDVEESAAAALKERGRVFLFKSDDFEFHTKAGLFKKQSEKSFSLPMNYGDRVIVELSRSAAV